jgi:outer membrane protein assembly factor BamB
MVCVLLVVVVYAWPSGATHHGATPRSRPQSPARPAAVRIDASLSPALLPEPRSRAVAVPVGSSLYVAGGIGAQQATMPDVFLFSSPSTVTTTAPLAVATHDAAAAAIGGRVLVFGGGAQAVNDVVQQSTGGGAFTIIGHLPAPRADFGAVTLGDTAYLVGGYDGTSPAQDVLATTDGTSFRTIARLATPVRYPALAARGQTIYVFGGEWNGVASSAVQAIDTATGQASNVGTLPSARTQASAFTLDGALYLAGGLDGGIPSADILRFDPTTGRFASVGSLPNPVADAASAVVGNTAYLVGGEASAPLSAIDVLRTTTSTPTAQLALSRQRPFAGQLLIADRGNNRLIVVDAAKHVLWSYPSATRPAPPGGFYFPDDGFFVDHGRAILSNEEENHTIVRIAYPSGALLWSYGHPGTPGVSAGFLNQPDDAWLLKDGTTAVADAKNCRILFMTAQGQPQSQIGENGICTHDPGRSVGYPNGDTPLSDGNFLISEINGSWISEYTRSGSLVWTVQLPITYPSDPQQLGPDLYLVADYTKPGGLVEFTREGRIVWTYRPASGNGMLDHPSLAEQLPNGLIAVNDDYRHRVVFIDPATNNIVWQYGATDRPGTGADQLNTPDGFDLLLPDNTTPAHPSTG